MIFRRRPRSLLPIAAVALLALPAFAAEVPVRFPDPNGKPDAKQEARKKARFDPVLHSLFMLDSMTVNENRAQG